MRLCSRKDLPNKNGKLSDWLVLKLKAILDLKSKMIVYKIVFDRFESDLFQLILFDQN